MLKIRTFILGTLVLILFLQPDIISAKIRNKSNQYKRNVSYELQNNLIYLTQIEINGVLKRYKFLLDNGCRDCFISSSLASDLKIHNTKTKRVSDAYGHKEELLWTKLNFTIGGIDFNNIKTSILDDDSFKQEGCDVHGIIGRNLIEKCIWQISMSNGICITNNINSISTQDYNHQKLVFGTGVDLGFSNGDSAVAAIIDLGCQSFVNLTPNALSEINTGQRIENNVQTNSPGFSGIFSSDINKDTAIVNDVDKAIVKGFFFTGEKDRVINPIIDIDSKDDSYIPLVGCKVLNYYNIILDGINEEFYYQNFNQYYDQESTFGFGFQVNDSSVYINYLVMDSSAQKAGLIVGDKILEINEIKIDELISGATGCNINGIIMQLIKASSTVRIKIARRSETIVLNECLLFN